MLREQDLAAILLGRRLLDVLPEIYFAPEVEVIGYRLPEPALDT